MKKIDRLIIKSFIGPFIVTFFIAMFVLIMQFLWKYIDDLVGKGLEGAIIAELLFYLSASVVPLAMPIAILLASIMTFGKLGENYELVSLKSAGISFVRFMSPLLVIAIMLSGVAFTFSNYVLPVANLKFAAMLYSVTKQRPALNIKQGVFYSGIDGYVIRIGKKDPDSKTVYDIKIHDHTEKRGNVNVLLAEKGEMFTTTGDSVLVFKLFNGTRYEEPKAARGKEKKHEFMRTKFSEYEMIFDLANFDFEKTDESLFRSNQRMLNVKQLLTATDSLVITQKDRKINFEQNMKPYFSFIKDSTLFFAEEMQQREDSLKILRAKKEKEAALQKPKKKVSAKIDIMDEKPKKRVTKEKSDNNKTLAQKKAQEKFEATKKKKPNKKKTQSLPNAKSLKQKAKKEKEKEAEKPKVYLAKAKLDSISPFLGTLQLTASQGEALVKRGKNLGRNVKSFLRVNERQDAGDTKKIIRYMIEVHSKITLSLACLVLFLIGAPLGALIRKGGLGLPMVMAILFFVIFHIISTMGKKFAEEMVLSPFAGMWLSTAVLLPLGLYLLYLANNDKQIVDFSFYTDGVKRLFRKVVPKKKGS
ncbi:MAG: LptF/LptG family permease [Chitinophagales bacterium]